MSEYQLVLAEDSTFKVGFLKILLYKRTLYRDVGRMKGTGLGLRQRKPRCYYYPKDVDRGDPRNLKKNMSQNHFAIRQKLTQ